MDDGIVRVAFEQDPRKCPLEPRVEHIMQEEIGQHRTDDTALRRALRPVLQCAVRPLHRRTKPPGSVQSNPREVGMVRDGALDQFMRDGIKKRFDVQIDDPVGRPASVPGLPHGVERGLARAVAIRVGMEMRVHHRLEDHLHHGLRHAVGHRRNAQRPNAAVVLRYFDEPHGRRKIRARRHPIPDLVEVVLEVRFECRDGLAVHPRGPLVRLDPLIRVPHETLRNHIRLGVRHRLLPHAG